MDQGQVATEGRLLGRAAELDVIRAALRDVRVHGSAILLHGDPGIGKSALLGAARHLGEVQGLTVLAAAGSEAESHLPLAALYELVRPLLGRMAGLPDEHRGALVRAFGLAPRTTRPEGLDLDSDRFFLGLATLELVAAAAAATPVLVLADDLQWWDAASQETLAFVVRRITALPVVVVSARRDAGPYPAGLAWGTALSLPELAAAPSLTLLREHGPGLSPDQERRLLGVAGGNPLALIELPQALARPDVGSAAASPDNSPGDVLPLTSRLEHAFATRLVGLGAKTRSIMLLAAALDGDQVADLVAAGAALEPHADAYGGLEAAVQAELVRVHGTGLRFRHPLVRSAILQLATGSERRAAHRALATALAGQPDRAAWHRAAATFDPDEEVAAALETAADHALERGLPSAAAACLERAAALSEHDHRRGRRLLRAAELAFELGDIDAAQRLMSATRQLVLDEGGQALQAGLDAVFTGTPGTAQDIRAMVRSAEVVLAEGDRALGAYLLIGAARCCLWSSASDEVRGLVLTVAAAHLPGGDPRLIQITAFLNPLGRGAELVERLHEWAERTAPDPATGTRLGVASFLVADFELAQTFTARSRDGLHQQGRTELLAQALATQAAAGFYTGRFTEAQEAADEACELTRHTHQPNWRALAMFTQAHLEAVRGEAESAERLTAEAEQIAVHLGNRALLNRLQLARGINALGSGQPGTAFAELFRMLDPADAVYQASQAVCGVDYLAEAAGSAAERAEARLLLDGVAALTQPTPAQGVRQAVALAYALLASDDEAEGRFAETARWAHQSTPWYRARVDLALGAFLRRQRRPSEAQRRLRSARSVFATLSTPAWLARADQELAALEPVADRSFPSPAVLSAQELQVARLAAAGLSNQGIAERLHLSPRTVASHLYRIFPKLGVRSRAQLHLALTEPTDR